MDDLVGRLGNAIYRLGAKQQYHREWLLVGQDARAAASPCVYGYRQEEAWAANSPSPPERHSAGGNCSAGREDRVYVGLQGRQGWMSAKTVLKRCSSVIFFFVAGLRVLARQRQGHFVSAW